MLPSLKGFMKFYLILTAVAVSLLASAIPIPGTDVWYSQFVAVALFGLLLIGTLIGQMSVALGLLFAYCVFSTIFVNHQDTMSLMCLIQMGACLLMAKSISELSEDKRKLVWYVIAGLLCIQIFWGFIQQANLDPLFRMTGNNSICDTVGFSGSHNQYGLFLAASSVAAWMFPVIIPFLIIALFLSKTFTAAVGFSAAWVFLLRKRFNVFLLIVLGLCLAISSAAFLHRDLPGKYKERFGVWRLSVTQVLSGRANVEINPEVTKVVTCNPFFGFGFQKFFTISPYTQHDIQGKARSIAVFEHAHNDYVEALFDLGIIGFGFVLFTLLEILYLFLFPYWYNRIDRSRGLEMATAGLIAYAVCAFSIYTIHTAYNGFFLCVLLGLFYGEVKDGQKGRQ